MKQLFCLLLLLLASVAARAQVGVGTASPDAKAALDIQALDKGLLIPRLTAGQRMAIGSPPQGLMVYQTDGTPSGGPQTGFWYYAGAPAQWVFLNPTPSGGGFTLPYVATTSVASPAFSITNTAFDGPALEGTATTDDTPAMRGRNTSATGNLGIGVQGTAVGGTGVYGAANGGTGTLGESVSGAGLVGTSTTGVAIKGTKARTNERGRVAEFTNTTAANDSTAAYISTAGDRPALRAVNTAPSGQAAIRGVKQAAAPDGVGVEGVITSGASGNAAGVLGHDKSGSGTGSGVLGLTTSGYGVRGIASANGGYGVSGSATNSYGVIGGSQTGSGVYGTSNAPGSSGAAAVLGRNTNGLGVGVRGTVAGGVAVLGENTGPGDGVSGSATSGSGVTGTATSGAGVYGSSSTNSGVYGTSAASGTAVAGVEGNSSSSSGTGVLGTTTSGSGIRGTATGSNGYGVIGTASASNGIGVYGAATGAASAVYGVASGTGRAGFFNQNNAGYTGAAVEINQSGTGPALRLTGEVVTPNAGTANLLPVAYGRVKITFNSQGNFAAATRAAGTSNWTVSRLSPGDYLLTFTSPDLSTFPGDQLVVQLTATVGSTTLAVGNYQGANGTIRVLLEQLSFTNDYDFCFTVYKP